MIDRKRIKETKESLNADKKQQFRSLIGQLNWISGQTRPDIAYESCEASVVFKEAKVSDVLKANKAVKKLKCEDISLKFPNLGNLKRCKIISFNDASYCNLLEEGSQGGFISFDATWMERLLRFSGSQEKFDLWLRVLLLQNVLHKLKHALISVRI